MNRRPSLLLAVLLGFAAWFTAGPSVLAGASDSACPGAAWAGVAAREGDLSRQGVLDRLPAAGNDGCASTPEGDDGEDEDDESFRPSGPRLLPCEGASLRPVERAGPIADSVSLRRRSRAPPVR